MTVDQILDAWQVSDSQRAHLLGQPDAARQIITIYDCLHSIFEQSERADAWPSKPNRNFQGRPALDLIIDGDIEQVRRYLQYHVYNA